MNRSQVEETIAIDGTPGTAELLLGILPVSKQMPP